LQLDERSATSLRGFSGAKASNVKFALNSTDLVHPIFVSRQEYQIYQVRARHKINLVLLRLGSEINLEVSVFILKTETSNTPEPKMRVKNNWAFGCQFNIRG
jgi:hypothetical protein